MIHVLGLIGASLLSIEGLLFALSGEVEPAPVTVENAERVVVTKMGGHVRVIGNGKEPENLQLSDTIVGQAVVVTELTEDAICNVLIESDAPPDKAHAFVKVTGSCDGDYCIYSCLYKGDLCKSIDAISGYLGSSMAEFVNLDINMQHRFLKTTGLCEDKELEDFRCIVPLDDPRAIVSERVFVSHKWSRNDYTNFVKVVDGIPQARHWKKKAVIDE